MSLRVRINVTEQHIRDGVRSDCGYCPTALAVAFDCPPGDAHAGPGHLGPGGMGSVYRYPTPPEVQAFISLFDAGGVVHPFSFVVEVAP